MKNESTTSTHVCLPLLVKAAVLILLPFQESSHFEIDIWVGIDVHENLYLLWDIPDISLTFEIQHFCPCLLFWSIDFIIMRPFCHRQCLPEWTSFFPLIQPISLCLGWQPHQSWPRFPERWAKWQFWRQKRGMKKGVLKAIELCLIHFLLARITRPFRISNASFFFADSFSKTFSEATLWNIFVPINDSGTVHGWHAPDEEKALAEPIERHPTNNEIRKRFQHGKGCKNHPINQPFSIVFFVAWL